MTVTSLKQVATASEQEIFDTVARHLILQGVRSNRPGQRRPIICGYRGQDGTSCAVGCLISDEEYDEDMEGRGVQYLLEEFVEDDISHRTENLLSRLQEVHDESDVASWGLALIRVAARFNLDNLAVAAAYLEKEHEQQTA